MSIYEGAPLGGCGLLRRAGLRGVCRWPVSLQNEKTDGGGHYRRSLFLSHLSAASAVFCREIVGR